ncbi:hypothetical protein BgiBS90_007171, partial [Biomphalaria glabrata]
NFQGRPLLRMLSSEELLSLSIILTCVQMCSSDLLADEFQVTSTPWSYVGDRQPCSFWDQTGCQAGECCVKEVISFEDLDRNVLASTICKPRLSLGELCLRQSEGYLCDCSAGLQCQYTNNETYGHCVP